MRGFGILAASVAILVPHTAFAEEAASSMDGDKGAIIITARLRAENAQEVPAAISVVGSETLARTYTVNVNQLSQLVPTLNYSSPNPRNTAFTIRGLGSSVVAISQANDGLEPGVGFYVDQVYHARPATAAFDFTDIDQIEVLRGPQGTVFGKNTTAGAISVTTKKPSFTFGAEEELSLGEQGFVQAKAAITGPLVADLVAFRLSGSLTRRDGSIYNVRYDRHQNNTHNDALRGQLLLAPNDRLSLRIIGDWSRFKNECCTQVYVRVAPTLKSAAQQYPALAAGAIPGGYTPPSFDPYDRVTDIDAPLGVNTSEGGVSAIGELSLGAASLTSVSAWRYWKWDAANDRDYTGLPIQLTQHIPSRQDQFSQELRIASSAPGTIEYVAGLYYFHQKIVGHPISIYGPKATYWLLPGRPANLLDGYQTDGRTSFATDSYAAFGELTWRPLPRLAITGGARYTHEKKGGVYDVQAFGGLTTGLTQALINDKNSILRSQSYEGHLKDGSVSGRVNVTYDLASGVMTYVSFAKGQKSGGINMSGLPTYPAGVPGHASGDPILDKVTVKPERNTTWEAGVKTTLLGGALLFNADAFYTKVRDYQTNVVDNAAVIALRSYLANIPKVTVKGVEFDASLRLGKRFSLRAAGAYAKGKYASYANGPCPIERTGSSTTQCDLTGKGLPGLPKWSDSIGAEYRLPVRTGEMFARADANAKTRIFGDATGSAYTVIKGYALVNASVGLRTSQGWEVAVFARNLFNRNYLQNVTVQAGNSGLIVGTPSEPRMIGVTFRAQQ